MRALHGLVAMALVSCASRPSRVTAPAPPTPVTVLDSCVTRPPSTEAIAPTSYVRVAGTEDHACALRVDGEVWCWGATADTLRYGSERWIAAATPHKLDVPPMVSLQRCTAFLVALTRDGAVWTLTPEGTRFTAAPVEGLTGQRTLWRPSTELICAANASGDVTCAAGAADHRVVVSVPSLRGYGEAAAHLQTVRAVSPEGVVREVILNDGHVGAPRDLDLDPVQAVFANADRWCHWLRSGATVCSETRGLRFPPTAQRLTVAENAAAWITPEGHLAVSAGTTNNLVTFYDPGDGWVRNVNDLRPAMLTTVRAPRDVTLFGVTTCIVTHEGALQCWSGERTPATGQGRLNPVVPPGEAPIEGVTAFVLATWSTIVLQANGNVAAWGASGGLLPDIPSLRRPMSVGVAEPVALLLPRDESYLALTRAHEPLYYDEGERRWRPSPEGGAAVVDARHGLIRYTPDRGLSLTFLARPRTIPTDGPPGVAASLGSRPWWCHWTETQAPRCFGDNRNERIAARTTPTFEAPGPERVGLGRVRAMSLADDHACAITASGALRCWGANAEGALGTGDRRDRQDPTAVTEARNFVGVAAGPRSTYAWDEQGTLWAWGANTRGELGLGDRRDRLVPTRVEGLADIVEVQTEDRRTCARSRAGRLWCWGHHNSDGILGNGTLHDADRPTPVLAPLAAP